MDDTAIPSEYSPKAGWFWLLWSSVFLFTIAMCGGISGWSFVQSSVALFMCTASFCGGTLVGFIFTIFGDEQEPFGKIRDAMIALASGITGIGIAKAQEIGKLVGSVHLLAPPSDNNAWFSVLIVVTYGVLGFYYMYFARVLVLNPRLAEGRRALDRFKISSGVSSIATLIKDKVSPAILLGREFIDDVDELEEGEAKRLREDLFSDDVKKFLDACETDAKGAVALNSDQVVMAANLHYYRVYFEAKDKAERKEQEDKAIDWISRALNYDPINPDLQAKLADIYALKRRYDEAASIIERLERNEDSPQYIQQWAGYFLLFIPGREQDAIDYSLEFHRRFPDGSSALFNASCGYAQLYSQELDREQRKANPESENRKKSLRYLGDSIRIEPRNRKLARDEASEEGSYKSLAGDSEFELITSEPAPGGSDLKSKTI